MDNPNNMIQQHKIEDNRLKEISRVALALMAVFYCVSLSILVSAAGVASPYWNDPGNENPAILAPGEIKDFQFSLQNPSSEQNLTFRITIINGSEVMSIIDASPETWLRKLHATLSFPFSPDQLPTMGFITLNVNDSLLSFP